MSNQPVCCQICTKEPLGICGRCEQCKYCSIEHQREHWETHKHHCSILRAYRLRTKEVEINVKRMELRRKYFSNLTHKVYDSCIQIAEELVDLERNCIKNTSQFFNELEYGISICLLSRSYITIKNEAKAIVNIKSYLEEKMHFLECMKEIGYVRKFMEKGPVRNGELLHQELGNQNLINPNAVLSENSVKINYNLTKPQLILREFVMKKISLLAAVSNILYAVKLPVMKIYELYTENIQGIFGHGSLEVSNCFFMVGSYYFENRQYYKAIACFIRAAQLRGNMAGDCYYNLGIIYQLLNEQKIALMMFQNSAKMKENQFGEHSAEVADVYHNIAIIQKGLGNFKKAIEYLEKVALIYSKNKSSEEYKKVKETIKQLQSEIGIYLKRMDEKNAELQIAKETKKVKSEEELKAEKKKAKQKEKQILQNNTLIITDQLLNLLNSEETKNLAELQQQLRECSTIFMTAAAIGKSEFMQNIKHLKKLQLIKDNQKLFSHVFIQQLLVGKKKIQEKQEGPQQ